MIFAPLAAIAALAGVGKAKTIVDRLALRGWHDDVIAKAVALEDALLVHLQRRSDLLLRRVGEMAFYARHLPRDLADWLQARAFDDAVFAAELVDEVRRPSDLRSSGEVLLLSLRHASADADVATASRAPIEALDAKPALIDAVKEQFGRASPFGS